MAARSHHRERVDHDDGGGGISDGSSSGGSEGHAQLGSAIPWIRMRVSQRKNHPALHVDPRAATMLSSKVSLFKRVPCMAI